MSISAPDGARPPVLLYACFGVDPAIWEREIRRLAPTLDLRLWPETGDPAEIDYVLTWNAPRGFWQGFPNLKAIFSLGAGVDKLLTDPELPTDIPLVRMVDPGLAAGMKEFVLMRVLHYHRHMPEFAAQQAATEWRQLRAPPAAERLVGIMGLGELGETCARMLAELGFAVSGWSRRKKEIQGVATYAGTEELGAFLAASEILVCLLPLTADTENLLNATVFARLPRGAYVINVARGAHLVEQDLLEALATGQIAGATLDVFRVEPLPPDHPFWAHPAITVVPHVSALTQPQTAAKVLLDNLSAHAQGAALRHLVDRGSGY